MKRKLGLLSIAFALTAAAVAISTAGADTGAPSATGAGEYQFTSDTGVTALRTFAFEARTASDGSVSGEVEVYNRALGQRFHMRIDCLTVFDNIAVMSGTITYATGPDIAVGDTGIFGAQDNGEGANAAPDRVTRVFMNSGLVCTDITAANADLSLLAPIEGGNIQVR